MDKPKRYRFNKHGVCTNPDVEFVYNKNKCLIIIVYARVKGGWIQGTEFWMTLNTSEAYGMHADGCWNGVEPATKEQCRVDGLKEALEFYREPGRAPASRACIKYLVNELNKTTNEQTT